jgi:thiol:disulfide interchange protein DsbC
MKNTVKTLLLGTLIVCCGGVFAQEAAIRKSLAERLPQLKAIDEISKTPIPGVFELRSQRLRYLLHRRPGQLPDPGQPD